MALSRLSRVSGVLMLCARVCSTFPPGRLRWSFFLFDLEPFTMFRILRTSVLLRRAAALRTP